MSTYRTLREAQALRDHSNNTLRFNRTRADAGMHGPLDEEYDEEYGNGAGILLWGVVGAVVLWIFLLLVLA